MEEPTGHRRPKVSIRTISLKKLAFHGAWVALLYAVVYGVLGLWGHPLLLPLQDEWDGLFYPMLAKMQIWPWWKEPSVGWPLGLNLLDHPDVDFLQLFPIKILYRITKNPFLACNLWFLGTFVLVYLSAYFSLRYFKVSPFTASAFAVLFSLLPYHFHRGLMHLFLSGYMAVPLILPLIDWSRDGIFSRGKSWRWAAILAVFLSTSIYYTLFSSIAVTLMGGLEFLKSRSLGKLKRTLLVLIFLSVGLTMTLTPWFIQKIREGTNFQVSARTFQESEVLGLRMSQMVLPSAGHRVPFLAKIGQEIREKSNWAMETEWSNLGMLGTLGFFTLVFILFQPKMGRDSRLLLISRTNIALFLFSTVGGLGYLFCYFIHPVLRAQNRVSVFLGFFSFAAFAILWERIAADKIRTLKLRCVLLGIVLFGSWEQTSVNFRVETDGIRARYETCHKLIAEIERMYPSQSQKNIRIFQIPFVPFPENPPVGGMKDYEHFRPFLLSERIQISYGVMRGRGEDLEQLRISKMNGLEMAQTCAKAGYHGIWINCLGLEKGGETLISEFKRIQNLEIRESLGVEARLVYVDLRGLGRGVK